MDANDFLMGGGVTSAKWLNIGATVTGTITRQPEVRQQTDFKTKAPKFFPNGDPMQQLVVTLLTAERDPADPQDDGIRAVYIKGKAMTAAVREAVKATGAPGLEVGGTLSLTWVGGGPRFPNDPEPEPKVYAARYVRTTVTAANAFLTNGGQPVQQPGYSQAAGYPQTYPQVGVSAYPQPGFMPPGNGQPMPQPVPQQYQPPAAPISPPAGAPVSAPPPNIPAETWARLDPQQRAAVLAASSIAVDTAPF